MSKIPYEDRTQPQDSEGRFKGFCALASVFVMSKALEMGFTFREVALAMFKMGEDLINYGSLSGDIEEGGGESIKKEAVELAGQKLEEVEADGIANIIRKYGRK